jgi:hypothetical protein
LARRSSEDGGHGCRQGGDSHKRFHDWK